MFVYAFTTQTIHDMARGNKISQIRSLIVFWFDRRVLSVYDRWNHEFRQNHITARNKKSVDVRLVSERGQQVHRKIIKNNMRLSRKRGKNSMSHKTNKSLCRRPICFGLVWSSMSARFILLMALWKRAFGRLYHFFHGVLSMVLTKCNSGAFLTSR